MYVARFLFLLLFFIAQLSAVTVDKTYKSGELEQPYNLGDTIQYTVKVSGLTAGGLGYYFWDVLEPGMFVSDISPAPMDHAVTMDGRTWAY